MKLHAAQGPDVICPLTPATDGVTTGGLTEEAWQARFTSRVLTVLDVAASIAVFLSHKALECEWSRKREGG